MDRAEGRETGGGTNRSRGRQWELFPRAAVYQEVHKVQLGCTTCQHMWSPTGDCWQTGTTGCPRCGGWTFIASYGFSAP